MCAPLAGAPRALRAVTPPLPPPLRLSSNSSVTTINTPAATAPSSKQVKLSKNNDALHHTHREYVADRAARVCKGEWWFHRATDDARTVWVGGADDWGGRAVARASDESPQTCCR